MSSVLYADLSALDPSIVGASARPMGMGGMFVSVADDPASLIHNPAAAARVNQIKLFSMSSRTLQEVNYLNYGIALPVTKLGVLGFSLIGRSVDKVPLTSDLVINNGIVDYSTIRYASFSDQVYVFTYALPMQIANSDVDFGLNAKFFKKNLSSISTANANGFNMDFGTRFSLTKHLDVGLKLQNFIKGTSGRVSSGTLLWGTGEVENIDSYAVLGLSNKTLIRNVLVGIDFQKNTSQPAYPTTIHLGFEWHPLNPLFLRAGYGQYLMAPDIADGGSLSVAPVLSVGCGLNIYGWRLDYAYRPDSEIKELASHWFSVSLVGDEPCDVPTIVTPAPTPIVPTKSVAVSQSGVVVYSPETRTVTDASTVTVFGEVVGGTKVVLNGEEYQTSANHRFLLSVDVHVGLNDITVALPGNKQKQVLKILRLVAFKDLDGSPYKKDIVDLATLGLIRGDYPDRFSPKREVSRAELATLIVNSKRTTRRPFQLRGVIDDVDILSSQGIMIGFPGGELRPQGQLTRGQLAVVLARMQNLAIATTTRKYSYLSQEHWAESAVQALTATGLYSSEEFAPRNASVTKEEMAGLLARLPMVKGQIESLYSFEESLLTTEPAAAEPTFTIQDDRPTVSPLTVVAQPQAETSGQDDLALFNEMIAEDAVNAPVVQKKPTPAKVVTKNVKTALPKPMIQKKSAAPKKTVIAKKPAVKKK
jgi:hypothetical protein